MSKAIEENKLNFVRIQFILEVYVYRQKLWYEKNELTFSPHSTLVADFLIAEKLLSLWLWNLTTSFFLLIVLWKINRSCMSGLFGIANLLEVHREKKIFFFSFYVVHPPPNRKEVKISIVNVQTKTFL